MEPDADERKLPNQPIACPDARPGPLMVAPKDVPQRSLGN